MIHDFQYNPILKSIIVISILPPQQLRSCHSNVFPKCVGPHISSLVNVLHRCEFLQSPNVIKRAEDNNCVSALRRTAMLHVLISISFNCNQ